MSNFSLSSNSIHLRVFTECSGFTLMLSNEKSVLSFCDMGQEKLPGNVQDLLA